MQPAATHLVAWFVGHNHEPCKTAELIDLGWGLGSPRWDQGTNVLDGSLHTTEERGNLGGGAGNVAWF